MLRDGNSPSTFCPPLARRHACIWPLAAFSEQAQALWRDCHCFSHTLRQASSWLGIRDPLRHHPVAPADMAVARTSATKARLALPLNYRNEPFTTESWHANHTYWTLHPRDSVGILTHCTGQTRSALHGLAIRSCFDRVAIF